MSAPERIEGEVGGIAFSIDAAALSDMDFLESLYDLQKAYEAAQGGGGEQAAVMAFIPFARALFGEGWGRIKEELRASSDKPHAVACIEYAMAALDIAAGRLGGDVKN